MTNQYQANMELMTEEIVEWLKNYCDNNGQRGYVVGLSGGIDSAVVAQLIKRACPGHTLGVIMPAGNHDDDREHGILAAKAAGIPYITVDLTDDRQNLTDKVIDALSTQGFFIHDTKMIKGNIGARLRMTTLYGVGNALNYLVAGTDNLAESYTGYFTKYGDGGVDVLPISHLTKGEVYAMGEYLGVPEEIMKRPPSAGFFQNQTDEDEMGVEYKIIDAYLQGEDIPEDKRLIIEDLHEKSHHKRNMPPGVKN